MSTERIRSPCFRRSFFIVVLWLKSSLMIRRILFRSSKWAVNQSMLIRMSTIGMLVRK